MKIWDTVNQIEIDSLPLAIIPGRFQIINSSLSINGEEYPSHTPLLFGMSSKLTIANTDLENPLSVSVNKDLLPSEIFRTTVSESADKLVAIDKIKNDDIRSFKPMVREVNEKIKISDLDEMVEESLQFLEQVCRTPITHLNVEIERVQTERARRIPPLAIEFLASHAEDWSRRTITGIEPERILSEIITDEFNIYENRLAASLIDRLYNYLFKRVNVVLHYEDVLKKKEQIDKYSINHWHRDRVYSVWGKYVSDDAMETVDKTIAFLYSLISRVSSLMDSEVYKRIPPRQRNETNIYETNIIENNKNYREVASLLKRIILLDNSGQQKSEQEVYIERIQQVEEFNYYCYMLVLRALSGIGYKVNIKDKPYTRNSLGLSCSHLPPIQIQVNDDNCMIIDFGDGPNIIIVPLPAALSGCINIEQDLVENLVVSRPKHENFRTLVLYPDQKQIASETFPPSLTIKRGVNAYANDLTHTKYLCHVSPFSFYNVERIGLFLRKWIYGTVYSNYPRAITARNSIRAKITKNFNWLHDDQVKEVLYLKAPVDISDISNLKHYLNAEINRAKTMGNVHTALKRDLEEMRSQTSTIAEMFSDILNCPLCHSTVNSASFHVSGDNTFQCNCIACGAKWGLYACSSCGDTFPFIEPRVDSPVDLGDIYMEPEMYIGLDAISIPCSCTGDGSLNLTCSKCGYCSKHGMNHFQEAS